MRHVTNINDQIKNENKTEVLYKKHFYIVFSTNEKNSIVMSLSGQWTGHEDFISVR